MLTPEAPIAIDLSRETHPSGGATGKGAGEREALRRPWTIVGFEVAAIAHICQTFVLARLTFAPLLAQSGVAGYVGLLIPVALLAWLVYAVSRRGSLVAYWVAVALLSQPTVKLLRRLSEVSWAAIRAEPIEIWPGVVLTLLALAFLLHPQNRAWIEHRRALLPAPGRPT